MHDATGTIALRSGLIVAIVCSAAALHCAFATVPATRAQTTDPRITISPTSGSSMTPIAMRGNGFVPGDAVSVVSVGPTGEGTVLTIVTVEGDGTFSATISLPAPLLIPQIRLVAFPASFRSRGIDPIGSGLVATFTVTAADGAANRLPVTGAGLNADTAMADWRIAQLLALVLMIAVTALATLIVGARGRRIGQDNHRRIVR